MRAGMDSKKNAKNIDKNKYLINKEYYSPSVFSNTITTGADSRSPPRTLLATSVNSGSAAMIRRWQVSLLKFSGLPANSNANIIEPFSEASNHRERRSKRWYSMCDTIAEIRDKAAPVKQLFSLIRDTHLTACRLRKTYDVESTRSAAGRAAFNAAISDETCGAA